MNDGNDESAPKMDPEKKRIILWLAARMALEDASIRCLIVDSMHGQAAKITMDDLVKMQQIISPNPLPPEGEATAMLSGSPVSLCRHELPFNSSELTTLLEIARESIRTSPTSVSVALDIDRDSIKELGSKLSDYMG